MNSLSSFSATAFVAIAALLLAASAAFPASEGPSEAASRSISRALPLGWGKDRETTFAGALESALAATDHPYSYDDLMGLSGLAFRIRWYEGKEEVKWRASSPIGEGPESFAALRKATGWSLKLLEPSPKNPSETERFRRDIRAAIDGGQPVVAYGENGLDMGVIYGYEEGGRTYLIHDYYAAGKPVKLASSKLEPFVLLPGVHSVPPSRKDAFAESLRIAVKNWRRSGLPQGEGAYLYGDAAYSGWIEALKQAPSLEEEERKNFFHASWWTFDSLFDARSAGLRYLRSHVDSLPESAREPVRQAISLYEKEIQALSATFMEKNVFLGPWTGKTLSDWTPEVRERERKLLAQARGLDGAATEALETALAALEEKNPAAKNDDSLRP
jgi:hypothetical protein